MVNNHTSLLFIVTNSLIDRVSDIEIWKVQRRYKMVFQILRLSFKHTFFNLYLRLNRRILSSYFSSVCSRNLLAFTIIFEEFLSLMDCLSVSLYPRLYYTSPPMMIVVFSRMYILWSIVTRHLITVLSYYNKLTYHQWFPSECEYSY